MASQLELFAELRPISGSNQRSLAIDGLQYTAAFLSPGEQDAVLRDVDSRSWQDDLKRRVQHYGYKYDYKARSIDRSMYVGPLPTFATTIGVRLVECGMLDVPPDQLIVNEYLPGQGIAPHVDCEPCFGDRIVTVSLGAAYEMEFVHRESGLQKAVVLAVGSALLLSGEARYRWTHAIRPRKSDRGVPRGRRVSLTFRNVILDGARPARMQETAVIGHAAAALPSLANSDPMSPSTSPPIASG